MGMAVGLAAGEGSLEYVFSWGTTMPTTLSGHSEAAPHAALVGVVMGSRSDWDTMQHAVAKLEALGVPHEVRVVSAHRTPDVLFEYAATAQTRGLRAIIAGAGGAAHLPGMLAAKTAVPVLGVPVQSKALNGMDSLLSIVQMPAGIPVATFAIGNAGAANAGLFAAAMLAHEFPAIAAALEAFRAKQTQDVVEHDDPRFEAGRSEAGRA
jgi:5-(carboxyamino)imidazole ribonucleotide mutase